MFEIGKKYKKQTYKIGDTYEDCLNKTKVLFRYKTRFFTISKFFVDGVEYWVGFGSHRKGTQNENEELWELLERQWGRHYWFLLSGNAR